MPAGEYLLGAGIAIATLGSSAVAAALVVRRRAPVPEPAARAVAWAVLATAFVLAIHLIPGALGILGRGSVATCGLVLLAVVVALVPVVPRGGSVPLPGAPRETAASTWIAALGVAAVSVYLLANLLSHADQALIQSDVTSFHLPNVAAWIQDRSTWPVVDYIPDRSAGYYPQSGDVLMLSAILPWTSDFAVRLVAYPFLALAGLSVYCAGRELAAPRSTAALLAAGFVAMPVVGWIGALGLADAEMIGTFAAGGYFLLRSWRTASRFDLLIAGVGLGLAFGTRWYGVTSVCAALAVWAAATVGAGRGGRRLLRDGALLAGTVALCGGFWLLRNLVASGNPFYPVKLSPLGITIFDAPVDTFRELRGFSISDYLDDPGLWRRYFWSPFLEVMGFVAVGLWAGLAVGLVSGVRLRSRGDAAGSANRALALVGVAAIIGLVYLVTPYTASGPPGAPAEAWVNARYVVPALLCGAPVAAWLIGRSAGWRLWLELAALAAIADTLRRSAGLPLGDTTVVALAVAAAILGGSVLSARRSPAIVGGGRRIIAAAGGAAIAIAVGAALESRYADERYARLDPVAAYINERAPAGRRIGLIGDGFGNYPLFGPRLGNEVAYIGQRVDGTLRAYTDRQDFAAAVARGDYDLVFAQEIGSVDPALPARQERWLPGLGYRPVVSGTSGTLPGVPVILYRSSASN